MSRLLPGGRGLLLVFCAFALLHGADPAKRPRVVSLSAPLAETMYAIGAASQLVAVTDAAVFPDRILPTGSPERCGNWAPFYVPILRYSTSFTLT